MSDHLKQENCIKNLLSFGADLGEEFDTIIYILNTLEKNKQSFNTALNYIKQSFIHANQQDNRNNLKTAHAKLIEWMAINPIQRTSLFEDTFEYLLKNSVAFKKLLNNKVRIQLAPNAINVDDQIKSTIRTAVLQMNAQHFTREKIRAKMPNFLSTESLFPTLKNPQNSIWITLSHIAVLANNPGFLETLLRHGADPNISSEDSDPLFTLFLQSLALPNISFGMVHLLLRYGANLWVANSKINILYHLISMGNTNISTEMLDFCLKYSAPKEIEIKIGTQSDSPLNGIECDPLILTTLTGQTDYLVIILPYYIVTTKSAPAWKVALECAAFWEDKTMLKALLSHVFKFLNDVPELHYFIESNLLTSLPQNSQLWEITCDYIKRTQQKISKPAPNLQSSHTENNSSMRYLLENGTTKEELKEWLQAVKTNKKEQQPNHSPTIKFDEKLSQIRWANGTIKIDDANVQGIKFVGESLSDDYKSHCYMLFPEKFIKSCAYEFKLTEQDIKALQNMDKVFDNKHIKPLKDFPKRTIIVNNVEYTAELLWEIRAPNAKRYALYGIPSDVTDSQKENIHQSAMLYIPVPMPHLTNQAKTNTLKSQTKVIKIDYKKEEKPDVFSEHAPSSQSSSSNLPSFTHT